MSMYSYLCPNCGSVIQFIRKDEEKCCSHCGNFISFDEAENYNLKFIEKVDTNEDFNQDSVYGEFKEDVKTEDVKIYKCWECGIEILTDEYTKPTVCSFCGNSTLTEKRLTNQLMPSMIIPFKIKKDEATKLYRAWAKKGILVPLKLKSRRVVKKITEMYLPFCLYDYHAQIDISAKYKGKARSKKGNCIEIDYFKVKRDFEADYLKIPMGASKKIPDNIMDNLGPFKYNDLVDFEMASLSGYYAEKNNYHSRNMDQRAEHRVKQCMRVSAMQTIRGYNSVNIDNYQTKLERRLITYALLPVWILNYQYRGKKYIFAMNGQTGKIVAERPISSGKIISWFAGFSAVTFIILQLIGRLLV